MSTVLELPLQKKKGCGCLIIAIQLRNHLFEEMSIAVLDGTTDVTRTIHLGTPTYEHKRAYTRVLMGSIQFSTMTFPANTPATSLDAVARSPLWEIGMDYNHPTGHGVGTFLGVHECNNFLDLSRIDESYSIIFQFL